LEKLAKVAVCTVRKECE